MNDLSNVNGLLSFIRTSPTAFHAVDSICKMLTGFEHLDEHRHWELKPGGRYYVTRNQSSVIAFALPEGEARSFRLTAAHSDSPTFKIKESAELEVQNKYIRLDVEKYGGAIFSTWLDRPLSVAGRIMVRTPDGAETKLVCLDRDMCVIPNVAIHMNREINNGYHFQANTDLMPLWGTGASKGSFRKTIAENAGVREEDVLGTDLFLYNRMPGSIWGEENAFVSSGRLDDLECAYSAVSALKASKGGNHVSMCCVFDNEEVGSGTRQGADSTFLRDTLERIVISLGGDREQLCRMLAGSLMLSADNAHAAHPNHPELSDPVNQAVMNGGVVIKFNASQKYTTDSVSEGIFRELCRRAEIPVQYYANRSDMAGGSTLGNISGSHVSVSTVDIGLAQLAMHSSWETAGTRDLDWMIQSMTAFYDTQIEVRGDGAYRIG